MQVPPSSKPAPLGCCKHFSTPGFWVSDIATIIAAHDRTPHPTARAALINALAVAAGYGGDHDNSAQALFARILEMDDQTRVMAPTAYGQSQTPQSREFVRRGWLRPVATNPTATPEDWITLRALLFRLTFLADDQDTNNIAGVGYLSHYLNTLIGTAHTPAAVTILVEAATTLAEGGYSSKQQDNASNRWLRAIEGIVATGDEGNIRRLIAALPRFLAVASQLIVAAVARNSYRRFKRDIERLLEGDELPAKVRNVLQRHLQQKARELGSRAWPEIAEPTAERRGR